MPQVLCGLPVVVVDGLVAIRIQLLGLLRRNDANLIVLAPVLPCCVVHGVNMQLGSFGFPRQFPETLHKLLLQVIGDVVLLAEEYNASL